MHIQTSQAGSFSEVKVQGNFIVVLRTVRVNVPGIVITRFSQVWLCPRWLYYRRSLSSFSPSPHLLCNFSVIWFSLNSSQEVLGKNLEEFLVMKEEDNDFSRSDFSYLSIFPFWD